MNMIATPKTPNKEIITKPRIRPTQNRNLLAIVRNFRSCSSMRHRKTCNCRCAPRFFSSHRPYSLSQSTMQSVTACQPPSKIKSCARPEKIFAPVRAVADSNPAYPGKLKPSTLDAAPSHTPLPSTPASTARPSWNTLSCVTPLLKVRKLLKRQAKPG
jgi:hypothetical protein